MNKEIAIFLNENGSTSTLYEGGYVRVFIKVDEKWIVVRDIKFNFDNTSGMEKLRESLLSLAASLEGCKIFIAKEIVGLPYTVLDKCGFKIWEFDGRPEDILDYVLENDVDEAISDFTDDNPIKSDKEGFYHVNLITLQESNWGLTSKQLLLPFLHEKNFITLEIFCSHIPPWFEGEFEKLGLKMDNLKLSANEYKVTVSKQKKETE